MSLAVWPQLLPSVKSLQEAAVAVQPFASSSPSTTQQGVGWCCRSAGVGGLQAYDASISFGTRRTLQHLCPLSVLHLCRESVAAGRPGTRTSTRKGPWLAQMSLRGGHKSSRRKSFTASAAAAAVRCKHPSVLLCPSCGAEEVPYCQSAASLARIQSRSRLLAAILYAKSAEDRTHRPLTRPALTNYSLASDRKARLGWLQGLDPDLCQAGELNATSLRPARAGAPTRLVERSTKRVGSLPKLVSKVISKSCSALGAGPKAGAGPECCVRDDNELV